MSETANSSNLKRSFFKKISMTAHAILVGMICGVVVWAVLDHIQAESLRAIFMRQVILQLERKADESIDYFRRELHRHALSVRLLASNYKIVSYVYDPEWASKKVKKIVFHASVKPIWMPNDTTWHNFLEPSHVLLLDKQGNIREDFQVKDEKLPDIFFSTHETIGDKINLQPHITVLGKIPHLIVPEKIEDLTGNVRGILMLVVPLDEAFPGLALQKLSSDRGIAAIVDGNKQMILASSSPEIIKFGEALSPLKDKYFFTDRPFPELSAANLSLQFVVMLPVTDIEGVNNSIQQLGRKQRLVSALAYVAVFTLVIFLVSGRISRILRRIREFSEIALSFNEVIQPGGNQLVLLEEQVNRMIQSVIMMREQTKLHHRQELQESNALKGAVLDAALDCIITVDQSGKILEFNEAAVSTFGYQNHEIIGKNATDLLISPARREHYHQVFIQYISSQVKSPSNKRFKMVALRSDGNEFFVELAISPLKLAGKRIFTAYLHDITSRMRAEDEIKSLAKFPAESPTPMLRINHRGVIIYANHASEFLLNYWECGIGQTLPFFWQKLIDQVMTVGKNKEIETLCEDRIFSLLLSPVNELQYVNVYGRDVTEIRSAEELTRQHQAELVHVCRLSTMGEMATGLAHELNQPLAAIVNYTRGCILRIENKLAEPEALKDAMEQVYRQAERAGEIIKRLRGMVGKREPNRDAIDVNKVVQESVVFSEFEARKSEVSISLNLSHEELFVSIDIVQVEQVLLNLIRNGMDAINDVNASIRDIIISTQRLKNNEVQISVADTGIGISDKVLEQLFDPFFSTKPTGMGMGLAISKTIIVNHGGHLWATKNKKMGTTFHVTLPITNEASDG